MKIERHLIPFALLLTSLLLFSEASGKPVAPSADCTQDPACLTLQQQAGERSKAGDLAEAIRLYKLAYEVRPDARVLYNIARSLHKLGRARDAAPYYQKFIEQVDTTDPQAEKAREHLEQIQRAEEQLTAPENSLAMTPSTNGPNSPHPADVAGQSELPIYKKWWFWTAIGGAGLVVVTGLAVGLGLRSASSVPDGVMLFERHF